MTSRNIICNNIIIARKKLKLTQRDVAEILGVSISTISRIERTPGVVRLNLLIKVLGVYKIDQLHIMNKDIAQSNHFFKVNTMIVG